MLTDTQGLVPALFTCVTQRLGAQDQDQEVKDAAISCTATAVAMLGDLLGSEYAVQIKVSMCAQQGCHAQESVIRQNQTVINTTRGRGEMMI